MGSGWGTHGPWGTPFSLVLASGDSLRGTLAGPMALLRQAVRSVAQVG